MSRKRSKKGLLKYAEDFAISLLFEASGGKIGRAPPPAKVVLGKEVPETIQMEFSDRRALLDSMTKLIALKNKFDPEDEPETGLENYRGRLDGELGGENAGGGDSSETETSATKGDDSN